MKIFALLLFSLSSLFMFAQCENGRYQNFLFPNASVTSGVPYGSNIDYLGQEQELLLDVYEPTGDTAEDRPLVIICHGGFFITGSRDGDDVVPLCTDLARMGYVVASITYRLGIPINFELEESLTEAVWRATHDAKAAVRYFRADAAGNNTYRIDPEEIYMGGSSAGGFIALHHAYLDEESEIPALINQTEAGMGGGLEGESGNAGFSSAVKGIVNIAGAIKDTTWMSVGDEPVCNFHGTGDATVPYDSGTIFLAGFEVTDVDGSNPVDIKADELEITNCFETYLNEGHVPHVDNEAYYDTTLSITSNFLSHLHCDVELDCEYREIENLVGIDEELALQRIKVYPNPTQDIITVTGLEELDLQGWRLLDMMGREVENISVISAGDRLVLDLNLIPAGIYALEIQGKKSRTARQILKE